jgi:hypothetical protein
LSWEWLWVILKLIESGLKFSFHSNVLQRSSVWYFTKNSDV